MENEQKDFIRSTVRENYARVAVSGGMAQASSCCAPSPMSVETKAKRVSSCCGPASEAPTVDDISRMIGYSDSDLAGMPEGANMGLGCGNPQAIAAMKKGERVLDLGSGGGFDAFLAARQVGETGKVIGVDMTPEMLYKARENARKLGLKNVEFRLGEIENLPVRDSEVDVIISNCVINLSPDKEAVFREAFRVLSPGGRLAVSDIVAISPIPEKLKRDLDLLSACISGAALFSDIERWLKEAGFEQVEVKPKVKESAELINEWIPGLGIEKMLASADIRGVKPAV